MCSIFELTACTRFIGNQGFKSLEGFGVMDGDTDVLDMAKRLASTAVAICVNLGTVQIKGLQDLVWWIHDRQTHNQPLIAGEFDQGAKRAEMTEKRTEKERAETEKR